jgi:hypothetical protein
MPDFRTSLLPSALSSLAVDFDVGQLTSDGGLVWLAQADDCRACYRLAHALLAIYLHERERVANIERKLAQLPDGYTTTELANEYSVDPSTIFRDLRMMQSIGSVVTRQAYDAGIQRHPRGKIVLTIS